MPTASGSALRPGEDAVGCAVEQVGLRSRRAGQLLAGHRVAADKVDRVRQELLRPRQHFRLGAAGVGDDDARLKLRPVQPEHLAYAADGRGEYHHARAAYGVDGVVLGRVAGAHPARGRSHAAVAVGADDLDARLRLLQGQAQRCAYKPRADYGDSVHSGPPCASRSATLGRRRR